MESGVESKHPWHININKIYDTFGERIYKGLPTLHAFTGFSRKGAFASFADDDLNDANMAAKIEKFTCEVCFSLQRS